MKINRPSMVAPLLGLVFVSCAHSNKRSEYSSYTDTITVQASLTLAKSSYVLGCVEAHKKLGQLKGANRHCIQEAEISVKENILYILDQK